MTELEKQVSEALAPILARNLEVRLTGMPGDVNVTFGPQVWHNVAAAIEAAILYATRIEGDRPVHGRPTIQPAADAALAALRGEP